MKHIMHYFKEINQNLFQVATCYQVIKDPDLRERNLGDLQGLVRAEAEKHKAEAYKAFKYGKIDEEIPVSFCTLSCKLLENSVVEVKII